MSVLDRAALEASPLADLHAIASELSIDGYRRFRRPELIDAILARQTGEEPATAVDDDVLAIDAEPDAEPDAEADAEEEEEAPSRRRRGRRGGRGRSSARPASGAEEQEEAETRSKPKRRSKSKRSPLQPRTRSLTASSSCFPTGRDSSGSRSPTIRRRRLHLRGSGQALRARLRRPGVRAAPRAAALGAVRLPRPDRHDQRSPRR